MEVIVSVALFSVIILSATNIFKLVLDAQRKGTATQNVQENLKYFLEVIAKEIRMGEKSQLGQATSPIFTVSSNSFGDTLSFLNRYGQSVIYSLDKDGAVQRFKVQRDENFAFISPVKINIDSLHFVVRSGTSTQSVVTVNLKAHALDGATADSSMTLQTSISSRYYK